MAARARARADAHARGRGAQDRARGDRRASWADLARLVALGTLLAGCERGCLSAWLADHGVEGASAPSAPRSEGQAAGGGRPRGAGGGDAGGPSLDLGGTDCSDGLARCVEGRVETSVAGHVPHPCSAMENQGRLQEGREGREASERGGCECRWKSAGPCEAGCVVEGLEVVSAAEVAHVQLCRPVEETLRPLLPTEALEATICADERVTCERGVVATCAARGQPARRVAACLHGCAVGVALDPGDFLTGDGAAVILCQRAHPERR